MDCFKFSFYYYSYYNIYMNSIFKLPIFYSKDKMKLPDNIILDLELIKTNNSIGDPIYKYLFEPKTIFGKEVLNLFPECYTTDVSFLKDTQTVLKTYKPLTEGENDYNLINDIWKEVKNDSGFIEKYQYVDWACLDHLNTSAVFLQFMSIYNLASPILSLFIPVLLLIIPFFIIKMRGLDITIEQYITVLKQIAANHAIGKLFTNFNSSAEASQKIYLLVSTGFYFFSIYQNIMVCLRFNSNMIKIQQYLQHFKDYIIYTEKSAENFVNYTKDLITYSPFVNILKMHVAKLGEFKLKLEKMIMYKFTPYAVTGLGHSLACFYELRNNAEYNDAFLYSFGFNGFIDNIEGLIENMQSNFLTCARFTKNIKKTKFTDAYYPALMHADPVKNSYTLNNMIITGPNAAGKTTILKTTLINTILAQQCGVGTFSEAVVYPFKFFHCYLNIPDTSGRDSLFQAECRRCKEILDTIKENEKTDTHLCVFDELYSGTNPDEAELSSVAFMEYLIKMKNIKCILTTHFVKICSILETRGNIKNYYMDTTITENNDFKYSFKLLKGISEVKGGIKVLKDMNYPSEIINSFANK
jgi:hypothetical protein